MSCSIFSILRKFNKFVTCSIIIKMFYLKENKLRSVLNNTFFKIFEPKADEVTA